ncbi:MAG: hypothetical protein GWN58_43995, partial [Anaerolineae bacterium]|nr:hypothetical protein [Anaerolineae bacterium]
LRQADRPVAWLSLDDGDNDPTRFLAYLIAALQGIDPAVGHTVEAELQPPGPPSLEPLLTSLLNDIAATPEPFILVLDDYHIIEEASIHKVLSFLLNHMPPSEQGMHLSIATRADPPLPLARLRARGQLTELHVADLRFSPDEVLAFLNEVMGLSLAPGQIASLERRTEGWIAGLQLAALSMQGCEDVSGFIETFTGSHRHILDYLTEEVIDGQSEDIRTFLLQTAILDRLSGPLCDAVRFGEVKTPGSSSGTAVAGQVDSQKTLEALEAANLFLIPLDEDRCWYRYHHLFAGLLRHHLLREQPDLVPTLHQRASKWYQKNGLIPEAVSHALASGDLERAADLVEWAGWRVLTRGEMVTLFRWLDALPQELAQARPQLGVLRAWALAFIGRLDSVEPCLSDIDVQHVLGDVAAVRAHVAALQGDVPHTIELGQRALELLPETKWFSRSLAGFSLGIAYWVSGELAAASRAMTETIMLSRAAGRVYLTVMAATQLGHIQEMQGLLHQAVETHQQALELATRPGARTVPFAGTAYIGIAEPLYEWNDLDGATSYAAEGLRLSDLGGRISYQLAGRIVLARVRLARGDENGACRIIQQAEALAQGHDHPFPMAEIAELRTRLWEAQGNRAAASQWAEGRMRGRVTHSPRLVSEVEQIAAARVLLTEGKPGASLELLARLLPPAETAGRMKSVYKILALQALALQAQGNRGQALSALERALSLAEPEGFVRTFVDEGIPMARLLRRALAQGIAPNYVSKLLAAFGESAQPAPQALVEPLTKRELEVLRLIAAGLSNREIAQELVVAVSTVKTHVNHIYGKLGVRSRVQAVAKARKLDML